MNGSNVFLYDWKTGNAFSERRYNVIKQNISYTIDEEDISHLSLCPDSAHGELNKDKMHHRKTKLKKPKQSIDCDEKVECSAKESTELKNRYPRDKRQFFNKRIYITVQCDITYLPFLVQGVNKCINFRWSKCMF